MKKILLFSCLLAAMPFLLNETLANTDSIADSPKAIVIVNHIKDNTGEGSSYTYPLSFWLTDGSYVGSIFLGQSKVFGPTTAWMLSSPIKKFDVGYCVNGYCYNANLTNTTVPTACQQQLKGVGTMVITGSLIKDSDTNNTPTYTIQGLNCHIKDI
jgi:hypothetical protein